MYAASRADDSVELWQEMPSYYHHNYLLFGGARAVPLGPMAEHFAPGKVLPVVAYRYHHSLNWFSSIGGQYLHLIKQGKILAGEASPAARELALRDSSFALARIFLENSYLLRIYHPAYLSLGFRVFYLYPLKPPLLPNSRDEDFKREFGTSLVLGLAFFSSEEISLQMTAERWRGVNTNQLHGAEFALTLAKRLN